MFFIVLRKEDVMQKREKMTELIFDDVERLGIFPLIIGVDRISKFFAVNYPPGLSCGFTEEEILAFERQAREDFDIPRNRKPPIAMVLIPKRSR